MKKQKKSSNNMISNESSEVKSVVEEVISEAVAEEAVVEGESKETESADGKETAQSADAVATEKSKSKAKRIIDWIFSRKGIKIWMPILIMIHVFGVIAYYVWFPSRGYFHSDSTDTIMWAQASYESGKLFDPEFVYACLLPFGGYLLMLPFMGVFGMSMTTHVIGMLLFLIIFSAGIIFMTRKMNWELPWVAVMFTGILLTVSISTKLIEIFWGHIIYYSLGVFFLFIGLGLYFKILQLHDDKTLKNSKNKTQIYMLLFFIWSFLCASNQIMSLTIFTIPVLGAIILERILDFKTEIFSKKNRFYVVILGGMTAFSVAGYFIAEKLSSGINAYYEEGYSNFSDQSSWLENFQRFPIHWLTLLGVTAYDGQPILSADGVTNLILIVSALVLLIIPVIGIFLYPKIQDRFTKIIILVHWIAFALIMMGYTFGRLSAANWRLSPIVCTSVMATVAICKWIFENTEVKRLGVIMLIPQFCVCLLADSHICSMPADFGQDQGMYALCEFIEENDLDYGYATFWNANVLTVVSDERVKVRSINVKEGKISKYVYQSKKAWYEDIPGQEKYFLLLDTNENAEVLMAGLPLFEKEHETLYFGSYCITVFNENIF